jgi:heterogeneous nuclear ribonucleoprotein A1/A3
VFPEPEVVDEVMAARPHRIDGRNVEIKRPVPSEDVGRPESTVQTTKIFVGSIKEEMTEGDLEEHFTKFGTVVSVALVSDRGTGKKRGFGFVQFADFDSVDKCLL